MKPYGVSDFGHIIVDNGLVPSTDWRLVTLEVWVNIGSGNAWRHQAITWTNVDLSSVKTSGIHLRVISQETPHPSVANIN